MANGTKKKTSRRNGGGGMGRALVSGLIGAGIGTVGQAVATEMFDVSPTTAGAVTAVAGAAAAFATRGAVRSASVGAALSGVALGGGEWVKDKLATRNAELNDGDDDVARMAESRARRELAARRALDAADNARGGDGVNAAARGRADGVH